MSWASRTWRAAEAAARVLVKALKDEVGLPIHFHTHDTAGIACGHDPGRRRGGRGCGRRRDGRAFGQHLQATLGTVVEALRFTERDTGLDIGAIREISTTGSRARQYAAFESGMQAPASEVYLHEMPGGQFTNLKAQARSWGWRTAGTRSRRPMPT
jgi:pyruvate carboxylase